MSIEAPPPVAHDLPMDDGRRSVLPIASIILGVMGFCTLGIGGLIGLILGIIAAASGPIQQRGTAIVGIVISAISTVVGPIVLVVGLVLPALALARVEAGDAIVASQLRQVYAAMVAYQVDNDDRFPPGDDWIEALRPYEPQIDMFLAPRETPGQRGFAINAAVAGRRASDLSDPMRTPLLIEIEPGGPLAAGRDDLPPVPHSVSGYRILFADGRAGPQPMELHDNLLWDP